MTIYNFILQEVELLRGIFKAKFNVDCTIQAAAALLLTKKTPKDILKFLLYLD